MEIGETKTEKNVAKAIVETIAFFDLFSYPLTALEIWKYISIECGLSEVLEVLENIIQRSLAPSKGAKLLEEKNGFYFLAGRDEITKERMARYNYTDKKFKRAVLLSRIFKFIPWIKMIAVGNIIGAHNLKKESDIDLFIITEASRVWLTRFFCVLLIKILGLRPRPEKMRDRICLSFFISEEAMDLERLMLDRSDSDDFDIYFIYWLAGLAPIYDIDNTYDKFIKANSWLKNYLPNWEKGGVSYRRNAGKGFSWFYHDVVDLFFGGLEARIKKLQLKMMPDMIKQAMNKDTRVVVGDHIIKLHANDRREYYKRKFNQRLTALRKVDFDLIEGV